jgi:acetylornithine deacetylase/succinyl-diaminopimelate desuccinylase-like protein
MNPNQTREIVDSIWDRDIIPALVEYIRIPNQSPAFDTDWGAHGHMDRAVQLMEAWARARPLRGMRLEVLRLPGRTPLIFIDIAGEGSDCVMLYGHLDKQPEMHGWAPGLAAWTPVLKDQRLYGRGSADDGYALFAALAAIEALQRQGLAHARCVILIEACEESGSYDLPHYVEHLAERIGRPSLVVCLDSGCGNYEQLWLTTSLRGLAGGSLTATVLREGVHSGAASGTVPSSFRILRMLLSRLEDEASGRILPPWLHADIPPQRLQQARQTAGLLGAAVRTLFPFVAGMHAAAEDRVELLLNRTWRPALSITGAAGLPPLEQAGNVLRPSTSLKLSLRLPPTLEAGRATESLRQLLESDPPYGSQVRFEAEAAASGWNAPPLVPWLEQAVDAASHEFFGAPAAYMGEGGTIPFMGMLGEKFPQAQFVVTGVLGPSSNAHGPNEFLHIPTGKRVSACIASVLHAHYAASGRAAG